MVARTYDGSYTETSTSGRVVEDRRSYGHVGETLFLWIAWAVVFAFWAFTMSSFFGILQDIGAAGPGTLMGGVDLGGAGFALMGVVGGVIVLGLVMIYGAARWATRDKRLDPMTEAATARLYDEASDRRV